MLLGRSTGTWQQIDQSSSESTGDFVASLYSSFAPLAAAALSAQNQLSEGGNQDLGKRGVERGGEIFGDRGGR